MAYPLVHVTDTHLPGCNHVHRITSAKPSPRRIPIPTTRRYLSQTLQYRAQCASRSTGPSSAATPASSTVSVQTPPGTKRRRFPTSATRPNPTLDPRAAHRGCAGMPCVRTASAAGAAALAVCGTTRETSASIPSLPPESSAFQLLLVRRLPAARLPAVSLPATAMRTCQGSGLSTVAPTNAASAARGARVRLLPPSLSNPLLYSRWAGLVELIVFRSNSE